MIYLILLLLITHFLVLYLLKKYLDAYKQNNHNYISDQLYKIDSLFTQSIRLIESDLTVHYNESNTILKKLNHSANDFSRQNTKKFNELTSFIKSDYRSMTQLLRKNNDLLGKLVENTNINITKNQELKPLLENSNEALEKVYGKIKMSISNYEKSLKDIKIEIEDVLSMVQKTTNDKIQQIAVNGEKTISKTLEINREAITTITEDTSKQLKHMLQDNQIKFLANKIEHIDEELKLNLSQIYKLISSLDTSFITELRALKKGDKIKKGFFGF